MVYSIESPTGWGQRGYSGLNYHFSFSCSLSYLNISVWAQAHWLVSNAHFPICPNGSFFPKIVLCPSTQPSPGTMPYFSKSWPSDTSNPFIRGSVHLWFLDYHMKGKSSKGGREKLPKKYSPLNKSHPSLCLIPKKKHRHWTKSGSRGGYGETYSLKVLAHEGVLFDFQTINPIILDFEMSLHKESSEPL